MNTAEIKDKVNDLSHAVSNAKDMPQEARDIVQGLTSLFGVALVNQARQADALEQIASNLNTQRP